MSAAEVARRWAETAEERQKDDRPVIEAALLAQTWALVSIAESLANIIANTLDVSVLNAEGHVVSRFG